MSRGLKIWLLGWVFAASALIIVAQQTNLQYARLLLWTFGQSETAIGAWMGTLKYPPFKATVIGVIGGTIAVTHHYFASDLLKPVLEKLGLISEKGWGSGLYLKTRKTLYLLLPVLSFLPDGGSLFSILVAKKCGLNRWMALALIQFGNIVKNIAYGFGFNLLSVLGQNVTLIAYTIMIGSSLVLVAPYLKSIGRVVAANIRKCLGI